MITITTTHARVALANILRCLHRRSAVRHAEIAALAERPSFFWLAETAGLNPHLTRVAFHEEIVRVKAAGFGLKGKGRVGGGRK